MKFIGQLYLQHQTWLRLISLALLLSASLGIFLFFVKVAADNSYDPGLIAAFDNDSANAVKVLHRTRLWNDNSWDIYGPSYYRISRLLYRATHLSSQSSDKAALPYFFLQVTALVALFALSYLISWSISSSLPYQLLMLPFFAWAFTRDYTWIFVVFRAHPDILFALFVAVAGFFSVKTILQPEKKTYNWRLAAIFWGLCGLTKLTTLLFLPALAFPLLSFAKREWWQRFRQFAGWAFGSYLIAGFPQSFDLGPFFFLNRQSKHIERATSESVAEWAGLFWDQGHLPGLLLILFCLLIPARRKLVDMAIISKQQCLLSLGFLLTPVLTLLTRKVNSPHDWYPMPFIMLIFLALSLSIPSLTSQLESRFKKLREIPTSPIFLFCIALSLPWLMPEYDITHKDVLFENRDCFAEAEKVKSIIDREIAAGGKAVVTSFVPFSFRHNPDRGPKDQRKVEAHYRPTFDLIEKVKPSILVMNRKYYMTYFHESERYAYLQTLKQTQDFFSKFQSGQPFIGRNGKRWTLRQSLCDYEVWKQRPENI